MSSRSIGLLVLLLVILLRQPVAHSIDAVKPQPFLSGRRLAEGGSSGSEPMNALSAGTERIDPLDNFKKYEGGYNITNKHYWSSVIFAGKYGYSIGMLWLLGGLIAITILFIRTICSSKKTKKESKRLSCSKKCRFWPIILGVSLTFLAIISSGVVLGSSSRFDSRATKIKDIVIETVQEALGTIHNVTGAVRAMQQDGDLSSDLEFSSSLDLTSTKLEDEADSIQRKAEKNMNLVKKGLKILKLMTIVSIVLNLAVILALLATESLKFHRVSHLLIVLCWLLMFLLWLYFGLYFSLSKFSGDTCTALNDYRQDPSSSSLGSILPCNDQNSAKSILEETGSGIHDIIDQVNVNISKVQSYISGMEYVCNPFSGPPDYSYQPENCSSNTIQVGDIPQVLKKYACLGSDDGSCRPGEFISPTDYNRVIVYANSVQNILNSYPNMEKLVDCHIVKDAFSKILFEQCTPLKKYVRMTWGSLLVLLIIMVVLVLIRIIEAHHEAMYHLSDGSVRPQLTPSETSEVDYIETSQRQVLHLARLEP